MFLHRRKLSCSLQTVKQDMTSLKHSSTLETDLIENGLQSSGVICCAVSLCSLCLHAHELRNVEIGILRAAPSKYTPTAIKQAGWFRCRVCTALYESLCAAGTGIDV